MQHQQKVQKIGNQSKRRNIYIYIQNNKNMIEIILKDQINVQ